MRIVASCRSGWCVTERKFLAVLHLVRYPPRNRCLFVSFMFAWR